jgi:hypothetical protein
MLSNVSVMPVQDPQNRRNDFVGYDKLSDVIDDSYSKVEGTLHRGASC